MRALILVVLSLAIILATACTGSPAPSSASAQPTQPLAIATPPAAVTAIATVAATSTPAQSTPTFTASATADKPIGTQKKTTADGMVQMYVPAGVFQMGTDLAGDWTGEDEIPLHEISLPSYWIDQVEVTNAMYEQCVQAGVCKEPHALASQTRPKYFAHPDFDAYPVIQVDWSQADAYCRWSGRRLPSEAEWEKAARGPKERVYPWAGDAIGSHFANLDIYDDWPNADTTAVGKYPAGASPYGALDMAGNVYEWTADWYAADYYGKSPLNQPTGPETGTARVIRGGAWSSDKLFLRTASRMSFYPDLAANDIGFRCAESEGNP